MKKNIRMDFPTAVKREKRQPFIKKYFPTVTGKNDSRKLR